MLVGVTANICLSRALWASNGRVCAQRMYLSLLFPWLKWYKYFGGLIYVLVFFFFTVDVCTYYVWEHLQIFKNSIDLFFF